MWDSKTLGLAEKKEERKEGEVGDGGKEAKEEGERKAGEEGGGRGRKWEGKALVFSGRLSGFRSFIFQKPS